MPYYPKSQIITDLHTNGGEFTTRLNDPSTDYKGYYWKTLSGLFFSGKNPQDNPTQPLYILGPNPSINPQNIVLPSVNLMGYSSINAYNKIFKNSSQQTPQDLYLPIYISNTPTSKDYQNMKYERYFCKKANEFSYIEFDKDLYDRLVKQDPKLLYQLYIPFKITWQLMGDRESVYNVNKNMVSLMMKQQKFYFLDQYLKEDYDQYYKYYEVTDLYTKGEELITQDNKNYIGYYHVDSEEGPMEGAKSTNPPKLLYPVKGFVLPTTSSVSSQPTIAPPVKQWMPYNKEQFNIPITPSDFNEAKEIDFISDANTPKLY